MLLPVCNFGATSTVPSQSIQMVAASSQFVSISDANFGAYNLAKWAISVWVKRAASGAQQMIYCHTDGGTSRAFDIFFQGDDTLRWRTSQNGTTANNGELTTTATYTSTAAYYHLLYWYDSANATAGDRMRMWVNGSEITLFTSDVNPTAAIFNSTADVCVGSQTNPASTTFDGLIYQASFFSGTLPLISSLYNAGVPQSVIGLPGLWSTLDVAGGVVTHDGVIATAWTNHATATASTTIP